MLTSKLKFNELVPYYDFSIESEFVHCYCIKVGTCTYRSIEYYCNDLLHKSYNQFNALMKNYVTFICKLFV